MFNATIEHSKRRSKGRKGAGARARQQQRFKERKLQDRTERALEISTSENLFFNHDPKCTKRSIGSTLRRMEVIREANPDIEFCESDSYRDVRRRVENERTQDDIQSRIEAFKQSLRDNSLCVRLADCQSSTDLTTGIVLRHPWKAPSEEPVYLEDSFLQVLFLSEPLKSIDLTDKCCEEIEYKSGYGKWQRKILSSSHEIPDKLIYSTPLSDELPLIGIDAQVPRLVVRVKDSLHHVLVTHKDYHYYVWDRFDYKRRDPELRFYNADCIYAWTSYNKVNGHKINLTRLKATGCSIKIHSIYQVRFLSSRGLVLPRLPAPLKLVHRDAG